MKVPLQEDEHEALLELTVVGLVFSGKWDHVSVTAATETRLANAGAIVRENGRISVTELGKRLIKRDSAFRSHGILVVE